MSEWTIIEAQRMGQRMDDAAEAAQEALKDANAVLSAIRDVAAAAAQDRAAIDAVALAVSFDAGIVTIARDQVAPAEAGGLTPDERYAASVDMEATRRMSQGSFEFRGNRYQGREKDFVNFGGASTAALLAVMNGAQPGDYQWATAGSDFEWITLDNRYVKLDAQSMLQLGLTAMRWRDAHVKAARDIKDTVPRPDDFKADALWPQNQ